MSQPQVGTYSRDQMEKLAENKDNIVMMEEESTAPTAQYKFRNEFLGKQVMEMRRLFELYLVDYPTYDDNMLRTKILHSKQGRENSWTVIASRQKFVFDVVLKKFANQEDKKKYDSLLKIIKLEELKEKGFIKTEAEVQAYFKQVGLSDKMNPVQHALEQIKK